MPFTPSCGIRLPLPRALGLALAVAIWGGPMAPLEASRRDSSGGASLYQEALRFVDDAGTPLELSTFQGRQVILTMFYTQCRSACPATLGKLRQIDKAFAERGRPIEIVLVSYDSDFDRPKMLARFRDREKVPPQWRLLSGRPDQVQRLAERIGLGRYLDMGDHIFHAYRIVLLDEAGAVKKALDSYRDKVPSLFEGEGEGDLRAPDRQP